MSPPNVDLQSPGGLKPGSHRRRLLWMGGMALLLLGVAATCRLRTGRGLQSAGQAASPATAEQIRRSNRAMEAELKLADSGDLYLLLDLVHRELVLKSHGVPLRAFPLQGGRTGIGRLSLARGKLEASFATAWGDGTLLPPRNKTRAVILSDSVTPPDPSGMVSFIPPTPEEEFPTPPTFRVRYPGRGSLLVRVPEGPLPEGDSAVVRELSATGKLVHWMRLRPWRRDRLTLEVELDPADAGALYRAFPEGAALLVSGVSERGPPP